MSDRKPVGDLVDFPTGRDGAASPPAAGRGGASDSGQVDLFAETADMQSASDARGAASEAPQQFWHEDANDADLAEQPPAQQDMDLGADADSGYQPVGDSGAVSYRSADELVDGPPGLLSRWFGGAVDVSLHLAVAALGVGAMLRLGLVPSAAVWPGFVAFLLCFSFVYITLPLAFWGQTPGMAWGGMRAHDRDGLSLTFVQAMLRWAASVVTAGLIGLPLVVALSGRSLADRLSSSQTLLQADEGFDEGLS